MTLVIDEDVLVMPIFNLQDVAGKRVGSQALAEGVLSFLEVLRLWIASAKLVHEVLVQGCAVLAMDLVKALRVRHELDQATVQPSCQNLIRLHPQIAPFELEDLIDLAYKLHRKLLLPDVIVCLDDNTKQSP